MTQDPQHLHNRLNELVKHVEAMRSAQRAFFSLPSITSPAVKGEFIRTSKQAEQRVDDYIKLIKYEKTV